MSRQSDRATLLVLFDAFLDAVLEATSQDQHAVLQARASMFKAALGDPAQQSSQGSATGGAPTQSFTVTVLDMGSAVYSGLSALADALQLSANTCSASLSKHGGEWRLPMRNDPHSGNPTVDMTVRRGAAGEHNDRVADFIKLTLPGSVRGRAAREARANKERKAALRAVPKGGNKLNAVADRYEN